MPTCIRGNQADRSRAHARDALAESLGVNNVLFCAQLWPADPRREHPGSDHRHAGHGAGLRRAVRAMACNTPLNVPPDDVVEASVAMYPLGDSRRYGLLEWPSLLRMLDRADAFYQGRRSPPDLKPADAAAHPVVDLRETPHA